MTVEIGGQTHGRHRTRLIYPRSTSPFSASSLIRRGIKSNVYRLARIRRNSHRNTKPANIIGLFCIVGLRIKPWRMQTWSCHRRNRRYTELSTGSNVLIMQLAITQHEKKTSPQSNSRTARRSSADKTNSKLPVSHSCSMLTPPLCTSNMAAASGHIRQGACVFRVTFLQMNFASTPTSILNLTIS